MNISHPSCDNLIFSLSGYYSLLTPHISAIYSKFIWYLKMYIIYTSNGYTTNTNNIIIQFVMKQKLLIIRTWESKKFRMNLKITEKGMDQKFDIKDEYEQRISYRKVNSLMTLIKSYTLFYGCLNSKIVSIGSTRSILEYTDQCDH